MRGEFIGVWSETWRGIWSRLARHASDHPDLFCELYRECVSRIITPPSTEGLADAIDDPVLAKTAFRRIKATDFSGERALVAFLEAAHEALDDLGGDSLSNRYFCLLDSFIDRFSLRYDLRRPCSLCPTLPGVFASLVRDLKEATSRDTHLNSLMRDFEDAVRDLRTDCSDSRIKTCIQKQVNLLEAIGRLWPDVTATELGRICGEIHTWPHNAVKVSLGNLYGFTSDYPGIRHGGTPTSALRNIDMRDLVAMSILLTGYTPYLTDLIDADLIYRGR